MPVIAPQQTESLIKLLLDAFRSREDMKQLLYIHLGVNFDAITLSGSYASDLFNLLEAAESGGWSRRLLDAFRKANPGNQALSSFLADFDLSPEALAQEPEEIPVHYRGREAAKKYTSPPLPDPTGLPPPARRDELPPGYTLPLLRNENFTGRAADLLALAQHLLFNPQPKAVIAHGLGGTGKTQLAAEFCYRYGRFFQGVHWIQVNPLSAKPGEDI